MAVGMPLDPDTVRMFEVALSQCRTRFGEVQLTVELKHGQVMAVSPGEERPRVTRADVERERKQGIVS